MLNALVGEERALVSNIHGTTRDTVEETIVLGDTLIRFIDTAGIRATTDTVERMGIERTYEKSTKLKSSFGSSMPPVPLINSATYRAKYCVPASTICWRSTKPTSSMPLPFPPFKRPSTKTSAHFFLLTLPTPPPRPKQPIGKTPPPPSSTPYSTYRPITKRTSNLFVITSHQPFNPSALTLLTKTTSSSAMPVTTKPLPKRTPPSNASSRASTLAYRATSSARTFANAPST